MATALLAATLATAPAAAAIKVATYTGKIYMGYDATGVFGPADRGLRGDTIVTRYVYDTSLGTRYSTGNSDDVSGVTFPGNARSNPVLRVTVTIGGVTRTIVSSDDDRNADVYVRGGDVANDYVDSRAATADGYNENSATSFVENAAVPASLDTSFAVTTNDLYSSLEVRFSSYDNTIGFIDDADAYAYATTVTVADFVPEPATWALMIGGFGAVGTAARRSRARSWSRSGGATGSSR